MKIVKIISAVVLALCLSGVLEAAESKQRKRMTRREYQLYQQRLKQKQQKGSRVEGVYKQYRPTPTPEPRGHQKKKLDGTLVSIHQLSYSVAIKGGLNLPLGETSDFHEGGFGGQFDFYMHTSAQLSLDVFFNYGILPYKDADLADPLALVADDPMTIMGGGIRGIYHPLKTKLMTPSIGAGMGYFAVNRAVAVQVGVDGFGIPIFKTAYEGSSGLGFTGVLGVAYAITKKFDITLDINIYHLSLEGGTSDIIFYSLASVGGQYTF